MEVWRCNRKHQVSGGATWRGRTPVLSSSLRFSQVQLDTGVVSQGMEFFLIHTFSKTLSKENLCLHKAVFKKFPVYTEMLETTENDVVPMPGLVWRRTFTP